MQRAQRPLRSRGTHRRMFACFHSSGTTPVHSDFLNRAHIDGNISAAVCKKTHMQEGWSSNPKSPAGRHCLAVLLLAGSSIPYLLTIEVLKTILSTPNIS